MTNVHKTAEIGDLVVAVFDEAARYSTDPKEVTRLATQTVTHILQRARRASTPPPRATRLAVSRVSATAPGRF